LINGEIAWSTAHGGKPARRAKDQEVALAPAEAIAAKSRTAFAPDLAMLVVAGRQLRQALG
jgi:hypothetical protein